MPFISGRKHCGSRPSGSFFAPSILSSVPARKSLAVVMPSRKTYVQLDRTSLEFEEFNLKLIDSVTKLLCVDKFKTTTDVAEIRMQTEVKDIVGVFHTSCVIPLTRAQRKLSSRANHSMYQRRQKGVQYKALMQRHRGLNNMGCGVKSQNMFFGPAWSSLTGRMHLGQTRLHHSKRCLFYVNVLSIMCVSHCISPRVFSESERMGYT